MYSFDVSLNDTFSLFDKKRCNFMRTTRYLVYVSCLSHKDIRLLDFQNLFDLVYSPFVLEKSQSKSNNTKCRRVVTTYNNGVEIMCSRE